MIDRLHRGRDWPRKKVPQKAPQPVAVVAEKEVDEEPKCGHCGHPCKEGHRCKGCGRWSED